MREDVSSDKLLGMDFAMGLLFFGGIAVLYSGFGGMRSVSYTDVMQLVMVLFVFFWVAQKAMLHTGGIVPLVQKMADQAPHKLSLFNRPDLSLRLKAPLFNLLSFLL